MLWVMVLAELGQVPMVGPVTTSLTCCILLCRRVEGCWDETILVPHRKGTFLPQEASPANPESSIFCRESWEGACGWSGLWDRGSCAWVEMFPGQHHYLEGLVLGPQGVGHGNP